MGNCKRLGAIAAAVVVFSLLLSADGHGYGDVDGGVDEHAVQFYLKCLALYERYDRGDYSSNQNPDESFSCAMGMGWVRGAYGAIGRLRPEYVEALKRWFKGNQTLIDMEICSLDDVRARDDIRCATLPKTFIDDKFFLDVGSWPSPRLSLVVANKIDEAGAEQVYQELRERMHGVHIFPVCAMPSRRWISEMKAGLKILVDGEESLPLKLDSIVWLIRSVCNNLCCLSITFC